MTKWIIIVLVLLLAGGGAYYWWVYRGDDKSDAPAVITAKVERGPIRLTVAATGRVVSLSDLSPVFVLASVDESDIGKVQLGQRAVVSVDAYPGKFFEGKVVRIATKGVNLSNAVTFEVKMEVAAEAQSMLKPEMTANIEITAAEKDDTLLVPAGAAVRRVRGQRFVTVVRDDGTKEEVPVEIGITDGTKTEITKGLEVGQTVVDYKGHSDSK
jgi:HlyD family secretion protein